MSNKKIIVPISGMHCKSCEILIEDALKDIKGVAKAEANNQQSNVLIHCQNDCDPDQAQITEAIRKAGYEVGKSNEQKAFFSKDKKHYRELGIAFLLLIGLYFVFKGLGLGNLIPKTSSSGLTYPLVFVIGITAGLSTCMALVGGLILGISARHNELHPEATAAQKFRPHLFFNLGRFLSYFFLGGLLGTIGSVIQFSSLTLGILTIVIGVVMLTMGLQLIEIFPWANKFKLTLPKGLSRMLGMGKHQKEYSHKNSMILGALTFFLPCGFTQAMQVYAVGTGSFWGGATVMGVFALGTIPGLLGIGGLSSVVKGNSARLFFKLAGLAVIGFALFNISNGLGLSGVNFADAGSGSSAISDSNVVLENGVQVVRMTEGSGGYSPNTFTIKKGVPVKWIIQGDAPYSCAATILLPKYNIRSSLSAGENDLYFTPTETGSAPFSCSMGMYKGVFNVVDENGKGGTAVAPKSVSSGGGTCGASGGGCGCGGAGKAINTNTVAASTDAGASVQVIKTTYTASRDIQPNNFNVKVNQPVRFEISAQDDGSGCMSAIEVRTLYPNAQLLQAGKTIVMEFTPTQTGSYQITCAMGVPRGKITVIN
jgi:sulfite exporter TauE/SafE/copper chaperone CopZ